MLLWHQVCLTQYQTAGGRFMEVLLCKLQKGGVSFACQPLHPHNSTMESEQLVLMARAMEFQTTPVYTVRDVA
jgi:Mg-chelatase subunit ChlI